MKNKTKKFQILIAIILITIGFLSVALGPISAVKGTPPPGHGGGSGGGGSEVTLS